ncbi:hypothetical protein SLS62_002804 [Diatrype stigma]|uniref:Peptidase C15, pyroglutamyl peptidase I-like protein n=1 Tax=Diatrype stigma TaxID=117547 RepID=A0AAN9YQK0_9PEZI
MATDDEGVRVLVTGFGPFQHFTINPSFEIVSRLPPSLPGIRVLAHPDPLRSVYRSLLETAPRLIREHRPDVVVHVGLAPDQTYFCVEQSASRDGYHQVPDMERRVLTKAESRTVFNNSGGGAGKNKKKNMVVSPEVLETSFDLPGVLEAWKRRLSWNPALSVGGGGGKMGAKAAAKGGKAPSSDAAVDVRHTDDVGNYVCGLLYYASLAELAQRGGGGDGSRYVVFLHVPPLRTEEEFHRGSLVLAALVETLVEAWEQR